MHDAKLSFVETKDNVLQVRFLQVGEKEQVLDLWFLGTPAFHLTEDMPIGSELPACTLKGSGAGRYLVGAETVSSVNEEYLNAHNLLWFRGKTILWYLHEDPGDEVSYDVPTQIFYEYAQNTEALKDNPMMEKAFLRAVDVLTERDNIDVFFASWILALTCGMRTAWDISTTTEEQRTKFRTMTGPFTTFPSALQEA